MALLVAIKLGIDYLNLDTISAGPIITAFVVGVIFTIAIIFTGTLTDYKESEKIPGELASSIKALYKDSRIAESLIDNNNMGNRKITEDMHSHIKELLYVIISNFKKNIWKLRDINLATDKLDDDINNFVQHSLAPPSVVKLRNELTNIDKISYRIETIMETTFIPAAYLITQIAIGMVIITLLFVKMDPYYEGVVLFGTVSYLLISLLLLIRDMDNPFAGTVHVDLSALYKLEGYFTSK